MNRKPKHCGSINDHPVMFYTERERLGETLMDITGDAGKLQKRYIKGRFLQIFLFFSNLECLQRYVEMLRKMQKVIFACFFSRSPRKKLIFESETGGTMLELLVAAPVIEKYEHQDLRRKSQTWMVQQRYTVWQTGTLSSAHHCSTSIETLLQPLCVSICISMQCISIY